ncbi:MAG TPA: S8 family serine peptidase [Mycobacteriales bacterium]|jgi:subtilisin family serine protease
MRVRAVLVTAAMAGALVAAPHAGAQYPNVCYPGVEGVSQRSLVGVTPAGGAALGALVRSFGGTMTARHPVLGFRSVRLPAPAARAEFLTQARALPGVTWAEPERVATAHRSVNDPFARRQWAIPRIGLPRAWDVETGKSGVVVAVLDTGVAAAHPDLRGQVLPGVDVVNDDDDATDDQGHGTHVAGTIAATSNNRAGVAGVAWGVKVLPVKVLDSAGTGTSCDIAVGVVEATDKGASILNMSLGMAGACPVAFRLAFEYAAQKKVLPVASTGNDAFQGAPSAAPGNCPTVLAVGATDSKDKPAIFSTWGPQVDVSAPGVDIMSTTIDPKTGRFGYGLSSGTSMAAPHVAGLAALLRSKHADWSPQQVADAITSTADDLGPRGRDDFYGSGRINAARALTR